MRRLTLVVAVVATTLSTAGHAAAQLTLTPRGATIRIGGRMHVQYAQSSVDSYNDQFFFRRARVEADITVNDFFDARLQPEFGGFEAVLKDAYVRLRFSPEFQLTMGQFKRPFDIFELSSSTDLSLVERDGRVGGVNACAGVGGTCSYSRLTEKLGLSDRDIGLRVAGEKGKVAYEASVTNGAGQNVADENDSKSFSGRVSVKVAPELTLSGNVASHDFVDPAKNDARASAWGVDAQYGTWRKGLLVQASLVGGDNWKKLDAGGDPVRFVAFQGVASYYAPIEGKRFVGVEPLLRLSWADPNTDAASDGGMVFTPGLMFYVSGRTKIGMNMDFWSPQTGKSEHSLKVQSFLYF
jgi:hypothetical protein